MWGVLLYLVYVGGFEISCLCGRDTYSPTASHLLRAYSSIIIIKIIRGLAVSQHLNYLCEDSIFTMKIISLWFMVFNVTFNNILVICGGQFYWWSNENN